MTEAQIIGLLVSAGFGVVGWFITKIFNEIERSRSNERDLYTKIGEAEKKQLSMHINILGDQLDQERKRKQ